MEEVKELAAGKKLIKLRRARVESGFIPRLTYEDESGRKLEYDGIFGANLDFYNAFLVVNYPQNFIPQIIEGEVDFENERYIGVKVKESLKEIKVKNIIYRFEKLGPVV